MSLQYLIDGYNMIPHLPGSIPDKLEDQRNALIRFLETNRLEGSLTNKVTVVFDGKAGVWSPKPSSHIKVRFSCDETADDLIKKMVAKLPNKSEVIVVTNDREICYHIRALGAKSLSIKQFIQKRKTSKKSKSSQSERSPKNISKSAEYKITQELKDIWLNKDKNN